MPGPRARENLGCGDTSGAVAALLEEFKGNPWFTGTYWPENEFRILAMVSDVRSRFRPESTRVLDIGCGIGYVSFLLSQFGYSVTATDSWRLPERDALFEKSRIGFFHANLNDPAPLRPLPEASFEVVLLAEVWEHVLNWPLGLLHEIRRVMSPGGLLVLTTPNPSNLMNAVRLLLDRHSLWGTEAFIEKAKVVGDRIIDIGDVHYREYRTAEVVAALAKAGLKVQSVRYMGMGASRAQPLWKRAAKLMVGGTLTRFRLFASVQYVLASREP